MPPRRTLYEVWQRIEGDPPAPSKICRSTLCSKAACGASRYVRSSAVHVQRMGSAGVGVGLVAAGICPMHGPVVKTSVAELVRKYR